ncbi:MAG: bifunctional [glutamate--ammonia ligase]-adenylyl-L-tyrosine phosphorylase/[glutamate--ammonia-ligase] adenylyltransferase [Nitrosomonadales bacterium]
MKKNMNMIKQSISFSKYFANSMNNPEIKGFIEHVLQDFSKKKDFSNLIDDLLDFEIYNEIDFLNKIRIARNKFFCLMLVLDTNNKIQIIDVMQLLSKFADKAVKLAYHFFYDHFSKIHGKPINESKESVFYVFALGKLGGYELNVSSDIDLIFAYDGEGYTAGPSTIQNKDFFLIVTKKIINALDNSNENGFVFRVDTRLRPFGSEGLLCPSIKLLEDYYLSQGRDWERYAWIKGRVIIGSKHVIEKIIRPFIYRKYLDYKTLSEIRTLKDLIKTDLGQRKKQDDIKLGEGGIREIEFIVQAIQLIHGGKIKKIQISNTLNSIECLYHEKLLLADDRNLLTEAYIFLRTLEHRIQYQENKQTHQIPNKEELAKVINTMGYKEVDVFYQKLNDLRKRVSSLFKSFFKHEEKNYAKKEISELKENQVLDKYFSSKKFLNLPASSQERIQLIITQIYLKLENNLCSVATFNALFDLIVAISGRSNYIAFFAEYPNVVDELINIGNKSSWAINYIKSHPILIDDAILNNYDFQFEYLSQRDSILSNLINLDNFEERLDFLRDQKHKLVFQCALLQIRNKISVEEISDQLTLIADLMLDIVMECIKVEYSEVNFSGFTIIAYGKYGAKEMSFSSDLDLIFLYDEKFSDSRDLYIKVVKKISSYLTSFTNAGILYDLDLELRPNGNSGMLVTSISSFEKYQNENAWTWEHQALTKARFCYGSDKLKKKFEKIRISTLMKKRDRKTLRNDIDNMRKKVSKEFQEKLKEENVFNIKSSPGGLIDIEFIVQYLILLNAKQYSELTQNIGNIALIKILKEKKLLDAKSANSLTNAYRFYREKQHLSALNNAKYAALSKEDAEIYNNAVTSIYSDIFE